MIDVVAKTYRQHLVRRIGNVVISRAVSLGIAPSHYVLLSIRGATQWFGAHDHP